MKGINWIAIGLLAFLLVTSTQLTISQNRAAEIAMSALVYTFMVLLVLLVVFIAGIMLHAHEFVRHKLKLPQSVQTVSQGTTKYTPPQIESRVYPVPELITDPDLIRSINNAIA